MEIELAEETFIMILAEHKNNDMMQIRQILCRGNRVKGINNGAYFTVEFGRRKTEDLEDQSMNKEAVLSRTRDHLPARPGKTRIKSETAKKLQVALMKNKFTMTVQNFLKSHLEIWKLVADNPNQ
jgi:hypothetical protein